MFDRGAAFSEEPTGKLERLSGGGVHGEYGDLGPERSRERVVLVSARRGDWRPAAAAAPGQPPRRINSHAHACIPPKLSDPVN